MNTIVIAPDIDIFKIPRRSFDPAKGDRRFLDQLDAINHADDIARVSGVRQVVRVDSEVPGGRSRYWLVQAVGS